MKHLASINGRAPSHGQQRATSRPPNHGVLVVRSIPASLTVVLADTQPAIRHGVRSVLERSGDIAVVGEAATADEAIAEAAQHRPDVLVIDLQTGEHDDIQVISRVLKVAPETGVLVFSMVEDDKTITSAIHAGARGYLVKSAGPDEILRGIQAVAAGEVIVGRTIAGRFSALMRQATGQDPYPFPQLTNGERDVLERIAAGKSNLVIARELGFASKTISNRVSAIFGKLGVADRSETIVLARESGLGFG
ncbi:MAG: response regulator transcription factor [Actinobacteria bacterium]|nr:response regulator transcription factor [Actinomycetota bacterium]